MDAVLRRWYGWNYFTVNEPKWYVSVTLLTVLQILHLSSRYPKIVSINLFHSRVSKHSLTLIQSCPKRDY